MDYQLDYRPTKWREEEVEAHIPKAIMKCRSVSREARRRRCRFEYNSAPMCVYVFVYSGTGACDAVLNAEVVQTDDISSTPRVESVCVSTP